MEDTVLCSECFTDFGLQEESKRIGKKDSSNCPNCDSSFGYKLTENNLEELVANFFVFGSRLRHYFGASWGLNYNQSHYGENDVTFPEWLEEDAHLLEAKLKIGIFYNSPPMWQIGCNEPLEKLSGFFSKHKVIRKIFDTYPCLEIGTDKTLFRLRNNFSSPELCNRQEQFDAPPTKYIKAPNRFNFDRSPVLYASENLEI